MNKITVRYLNYKTVISWLLILYNTIIAHEKDKLNQLKYKTQTSGNTLN